MIPLTNHDFQWGRSEVVIIYPDINMQNAKQQYYPEIYIYIYAISYTLWLLNIAMEAMAHL